MFDKAVKSIKCKILTVCRHILRTVNKMGMHSKPLRCVPATLRKGKWLNLEWNKLHFSWNTSFTWKNNWQTSCGYSDLGIWQEINKISVSLQGEKLTLFASDKIWTLKRKLKLWKICNCLSELDSFSIFKNFSGDINKHNFYIV